jgi:serine/threonine protein kinase
VASRTIQSPSSFPHFRRFTADGEEFELKYVTRLVPHHSEKAVFKAILKRDGQDQSVIVKFTPSYCARAHKLAHEMGSAPKLWFCGEVESVGMFVVVMDFVEGRRVDNDEPRLPEKVLERLRKAILALHNANLVHGDLRGPNVILQERKDSLRAMLLDFDWGGDDGQVFYPADVNLQLTWHGDVKPGALIRREHDVFMLNRWVAT